MSVLLQPQTPPTVSYATIYMGTEKVAIGFRIITLLVPFLSLESGVCY